MCDTATKTKLPSTGNANKKDVVQGSGSIVRLSMTASRAADPGSNPGRSTKHPLSKFSGKKLVFNNEVLIGS
jgi:hypothetical protein